MNPRIVSNPNICGGEPCIKGTRIPVHIILSHLAAGEEYKTILKNFPRLTKEDILACLEYPLFWPQKKWQLYEDCGGWKCKLWFGCNFKRSRTQRIAIAESPTSGIIDEDIFNLVIENSAVLITRDYHFTNAVRFPPDKTGGIIYIRRGNLTSAEEIALVQRFLSFHAHEEYSDKLVTLYKDSVKIR